MTDKKILIVDDDPDIRDVVSLVLEAQGYQVSTASDGLECFAKLGKEKPDLLILDLLMPKMDGFAVYKELQNPKWSAYKDIPILILTSVREEASKRRYELETSQTLNVDSYLEKPISPETLIETAKNLLKQKKYLYHMKSKGGNNEKQS